MKVITREAFRKKAWSIGGSEVIRSIYLNWSRYQNHREIVVWC